MGALQSRFNLPAGLATAVGALPQFSASVAGRLIAELTPHLASAPTLDVRASHQLEDESTDPFGPFTEFLNAWKGRVEPIVVSLSGPVTVDLRLRSEGQPDESSVRAVDSVSATASRAVELAQMILPQAPVVVFLEEPSLVNSMHPTFPLLPSEVEQMIRSVVEPLSEQVMVGVQVAGRADWSMLIRTGVSILGAPITASLESAAADINAFLEEGGFIAWGAVPVNEPLGASSDRLWNRMMSAWGDLIRLGLDPRLLGERSIITPAAHLGNFGLSQAERVLSMTAELSERVIQQLVGPVVAAG